MAIRRGDGVGHVRGFGQLGESHSLLDHELHLRFGGASGADERFFDLRGRIADYRNARLRRGEEDYPRAWPMMIEVRGCL